MAKLLTNDGIKHHRITVISEELKSLGIEVRMT